MNEIDNRIVSMEFDNKQFESNIQTSIKSLEKLDESLLLKNASKGFSEAERSASTFSLSPLSEAIDKINSKFSTLGVIGDQVLRNLTNSAMSAGKQLVNAFTLEPVQSGFQEYETQINSVQTILANTKKEGASLDQVNSALDELNHYADMTIYNFTEMTRNIGRFTAAGVDLDTSVSAIKGIANLAAVSGSTSQQTSTAMYQLSQALASGTVKLMDWNSVVNANMGGQVFQDALTETARVHGVKVDQMIAKEGSFRESLKKGWLTTDVLTETLEKFTVTTEGMTEAEIEQTRAMWKAKGYTEEQIDAIFEMGKTATDAATKVKTFTQLFDTLKEAAQSGWTQSWQYIIGNFEEAKELLTSVSDEFQAVIGASADARNSVLKFWHDNGGRESLIKALKNVYAIIKGIMGIADKAFKSIFPPITGERLLDITKKLENFTDGLRKSLGFVDDFSEAISKVAEEAAKVVDDTVDAISDSVDTGVAKNEEKAKELYSNMPQWMKLWVDRTGSADLKRIANWRKSNRDAWFDYWEAVTGQDMTFNRQAMDVYAEMPEWMRVWVEKSGTRDLDRIANWRPKNQELWNAYWDAIEGGAKQAEEAAKKADEAFDKTGDSVEELGNEAEESNGKMSFLQKMFTAAASAARILKNAITALAKGSVRVLAVLFTPLAKVMMGVAEQFFDWVIALDKAIEEGNLFGKMVDKIVDFVTPLGPVLARAGEQILKFIRYLVFEGGGKQLASTVFTYALTGLMLLVDGIKTLSSKIKNYISSSEIIQNGISGVKRVLGNLPNYAMTAVHAITEFAKGIIEYVKESKVLSEWTEKIKNKFGEFLSKIGEFYDKVKNFFKESKGLDVSSIKDFAKSFLENLQPLEKINTFLTDFGTWFSEGAEGLKEKVDGVAGTVGEKIAAGFSWFAEVLQGAFKNITGINIWEILKTIRSFYASMALIKLVSGVGSLAKAPGNFLENIGEAIGDFATAMKRKAFDLGGTVLKIAIAIGILVGALFVLSKMDKASFENAMAALAAIGIGLMIFIGMLSSVASQGKAMKDIGTALLFVSIAVGLLIRSANKLGKMDFDVMLQGFGALFVLMKILSGFIKGTGGSTFGGGFGSFIGMAIAVSILVGVIKKLGKMDFGTLIKGLVSVKILLSALASFTKGSRGIKFGSAVGLIALSISLGIMVSNMKKIADMDVWSIAKSLGSLYVMVLIMKNMMRTMQSGRTNIGGTILGILGMVASLYAFVKAMEALKDISGAHMLAVAGAFAAIILSFTASMSLLGGLGVGGAVNAVAALAVLIVGLGVLGVAVGALLDNEWILDKLEKSKNFMSALGQMIGSFIQGIANPDGIQKVDKTLGEKLSDFVQDLQPFFNSMRNLDDSTVQGMKNLASGMLAITGSGFVEGIASFVTNILTGKSATENFTDGLVSLAQGAARFQAYSRVLNPDMIQNAVDCANIIVTFVEGLPDYDFFEKLTGLTDARTFASDLLALGPSLSLFSGYAEQINVDAITNSSGAITALAEVAAAVPEEGIVEKILGVSNLKLFADELPELAMATMRYSYYIRNLKADAITNSVGAIQGLVDIANAVPEVSFFDKVFGVSDLQSFADSLAPLGQSVASYAGSIANINEGDVAKVAKSTSMINSILSVAKQIPKEGFFTKLFDVSDMSQFATNMTDLGNGVHNYAISVRGITENDVKSANNAASVIQAFVESSQGTEKQGGLFSTLSEFFGGSNDITAYSSKLVTFAEDMNEFAGYFKGSNGSNDIVDAVTNATTVVNNLKSLFSSTEAQNNQDQADLTGFGFILESMSTELTNNLMTFFDSGKDLVTSMVNGMESATPTPSESVSTAVSSAANSANSYTSSFYTSGHNMMVGLSNGIRNSSYLATSAASAVASAALSSFNSRLGIHSPSTEFEKSGRYSVMGLVNGFVGSGSTAIRAGESLAENLLGAVDYTLSNIASIIDSDMDLQPTIRPVFDMSNLNSGISAVNSVFASGRAVPITGGINMLGGITARNVGAVSAQTNQNGSNFDSRSIVQAINNVEARVTALSDSMAQMKVVLDSGTMVGQMLPEIDYQLGRKAMYNERGI